MENWSRIGLALRQKRFCFLLRGAPCPPILSPLSLYLKLAWLELNAVGTFTIGTLAVLVMVWFIATILLKR